MPSCPGSERGFWHHRQVALSCGVYVVGSSYVVMYPS